MLLVCLSVLVFAAKDCTTQDEEDGPYLGKLIGRLNSYHHQVSGDVYAVDDWTILLVNFNYDGTGDDTFFWAGDSGRPGPQGFIVPDQNGKTNVLERYYNAEVRLTLPDGKQLSKIKWFAIYDIDSQNAFGDVYIPDEFEPPAPRTIGPLAAQPGARVSSGPITFLDARTILIPEFRYDGSGDQVYFTVGVGPAPSPRGNKVPDEDGYLEPLRAYAGEEVRLELPGGLTATAVQWFAVWDAGANRALAAVLIPEGLTLPPSSARLLEHRTALPHCQQLHAHYQVAWEIFGNQITIELAAQIGDDEYMAFGISGSDNSSQMLGADVAVARYDRAFQRGLATDYNITALVPCVQVLGQWQGVCRDDLLNGLDSNQVFIARRENGLTVISYRRSLKPDEPLDREWVTDKMTPVIWALGRLDRAGEPAFHRLYHKRNVMIHLGKTPPENDCFPFTVQTAAAPTPWEMAQLFDPTLRVFRFVLGPAGGARGQAGRPYGHSPALAWYVNGQLAPDLQLRRGLKYTFRVSGGDDPHSASEYHPLVVTAEPDGGLERLGEAAQRAIRVLAGAHTTRRGRLSPSAAGPLCLGRHPKGADRRRDSSFSTFRAFNRTLVWSCMKGAPGELLIAPDTSWPDIVYYHSFTHAGMGGRIFIVDKYNRNLGRRNGSPSLTATPATLLALSFISLLTLLG